MSTTPETTSSTGNQGGNKKGIYIALIILLIILNAFFVYNNITTKAEKEKLEAEKMELDAEYAKVKGELDDKIREYEALQLDNEMLDSARTAMIAELENKKAEIEKLIKEKNWSISQYNKVKKQLSALKAEKDQFIATIDSLNAAVQALTMANDSLSTNLEGALGENETLRGEKQVLSKKVEIGSLLKPEDIQISGIRYKNNGSERETYSAKKSEKVRFCFNVPKNLVTEPGEKSILVRLVGPGGSTMAVASQGSGVFVSAENGQQMQYTTKATFQYENKLKPICIYWSQTAEFAKGTYKAYFYQNGYELAVSEFELN